MPLLCFQIAINTALIRCLFGFLARVCAFAHSCAGVLHLSISDVEASVLLHCCSSKPLAGPGFAACAIRSFAVVPKGTAEGYCKPGRRFKTSWAQPNRHFWECPLHAEYLKERLRPGKPRGLRRTRRAVAERLRADKGFPGGRSLWTPNRARHEELGSRGEGGILPGLLPARDVGKVPLRPGPPAGPGAAGPCGPAARSPLLRQLPRPIGSGTPQQGDRSELRALTAGPWHGGPRLSPLGRADPSGSRLPQRPG